MTIGNSYYGDLIRVLQMMETSRNAGNASRFADTIEYAIFANASGIAFHRVL
jgi:hypothetical protein